MESWLQRYGLFIFLKNTCFLAVQRKRLQQGQSTSHNPDAPACFDSSPLGDAQGGRALNEPGPPRVRDQTGGPRLTGTLTTMSVRMNCDGHPDCVISVNCPELRTTLTPASTLEAAGHSAPEADSGERPFIPSPRVRPRAVKSTFPVRVRPRAVNAEG